MRDIYWLSPRTLARYSLAIILVLLIACGAPAAPDPAAPAAPAQPAAPPAEAPQQPAAPVAQPTPTPAAPPAAAGLSGSLDMGQSDVGPFMAHPRLAGNPAIFLISGAPIAETLVSFDADRTMVPMLAQSWNISEDFLTWTFKLQEGVQFHKGFGEMTAEDVVWSYNEWAQSDLHPRGSVIRDFWQNPNGFVETPDPYTIHINTGTPMADTPIFEFLAFPFGGSTWVASKAQYDEGGEEAVHRNLAATGPWELTEDRPGFWRMRAVEDHWRQTPHFAELVFWEIPEESSRLAGFQTGQLDTFVMAFDSIPLVESVPGASLMEVPNAGTMIVNFYGNWYVGIGTPDQVGGYDPDLPWVSSNADPASPQWQQARDVRLAMSLAIDRESIMETLLGGFARPAVLEAYTGNEHILDPTMRWDYDPDQARVLLAQAGYPDGFRVNLTTALRGAPAESAVCEVIAAMWGDIGLDVRFQDIPYGTLRPQLVGRTYQGATCHGIPIRTAPVVGLVIHTTATAFSHGLEHPWLEDKVNRTAASVDPAEREALEREVGRFLYDHVLQPAVYGWDAVWPVGPNIQEWSQHVKHTDTRNINGFEYIRPRR